MRIEILRNRAGQWFWRIKGGNLWMVSSAAYRDRHEARTAAWRVWEEFTSGNVSVYEEDA